MTRPVSLGEARRMLKSPNKKTAQRGLKVIKEAKKRQNSIK